MKEPNKTPRDYYVLVIMIAGFLIILAVGALAH